MQLCCCAQAPRMGTINITSALSQGSGSPQGLLTVDTRYATGEQLPLTRPDLLAKMAEDTTAKPVGRAHFIKCINWVCTASVHRLPVAPAVRKHAAYWGCKQGIDPSLGAAVGPLAGPSSVS